MRAYLLSLLCLLAFPAKAQNADPLVIDHQELAAALASEHLLIIDTRPPTQFDQGHIPGAVNIPTAATYSQTPPRFLMATPAVLEPLFREAGLHNDQDVVVYDAGDYHEAPRMFWVLEALGKDRVRLLDGGWLTWKASKHPISQSAVQPPPGDFIARLRSERVASLLQTRLGIGDPDVQLIDSRAPEEHQGLKTKAKHAGHIPNSLNLPKDINFQAHKGQAKLLSLAELRPRYSGLGGKKHNITYCNGGRVGAFTYFNLRRLNLPVSLYDGAWLEWGNRDDLPIMLPPQ